jgi:hypothetical protein
METIKHTAAVIVLLFAPVAFGQTYIVPSDDCGSVTLHLTRGADFPGGRTIAAVRVEDARVYSAGKKIAVNLTEGARSLTFNTNVAAGGVVMAAVDLKPEISANETRTDHAKAFIFCGATPAADWQHSSGLGLEIYPQGWNGPRPHLKTGDPMWFIAVDNATNKLIGDLPMELYRAGGELVAEGVPAHDGGRNFPYQQPGRYIVVTKYRRRDPKQPEHWLVDTSTLTFEIQ